MKYAGFWKCSLAYMIDALPITLVVAAIFYTYFGFDEIIQARHQDRGDFEARKSFMQMRNWVRDLSFLAWLGYCFVMEASPMQGTLGKLKFPNVCGRWYGLVSVGNLFPSVVLGGVGKSGLCLCW